ncbi:MAG: hypothetical protein WCK65_01955 [Rhodospirillaceae bacterium]
METIEILYRFGLHDGTAYAFTLTIDAKTLRMRIPETPSGASWTLLASHQCSHCPLSTAKLTHCPAALNIESVIETLGFLISHEKVHLEIETAERRTSADVPAQNAISSILGLAIATSGCPHTAFLKPMARFHQPLASFEETIFRVMGTYLTGEYLRGLEGPPMDVNLDRLNAIYQNLQTMNQSLASRLRAAQSLNDAGINALIILNCYAECVPIFVDDEIDIIRRLFNDYLND